MLNPSDGVAFVTVISMYPGEDELIFKAGGVACAAMAIAVADPPTKSKISFNPRGHFR